MKERSMLKLKRKECERLSYGQGKRRSSLKVVDLYTKTDKFVKKVTSQCADIEPNGVHA